MFYINDHPKLQKRFLVKTCYDRLSTQLKRYFIMQQKPYKDNLFNKTQNKFNESKNWMKKYKGKKCYSGADFADCRVWGHKPNDEKAGSYHAAAFTVIDKLIGVFLALICYK